MVAALERALAALQSTTGTLVQAMIKGQVELALANSARYLEFFGHVVIGWMWLRQGLVASRQLQQLNSDTDRAFYTGKLQAMRYFARWELPQTEAWERLLTDLDSTTLAMQPEWF
jgi:butyryl-CoA dehydrogenase